MVNKISLVYNPGGEALLHICMGFSCFVLRECLLQLSLQNLHVQSS